MNLIQQLGYPNPITCIACRELPTNQYEQGHGEAPTWTAMKKVSKTTPMRRSRIIRILIVLSIDFSNIRTTWNKCIIDTCSYQSVSTIRCRQSCAGIFHVYFWLQAKSVERICSRYGKMPLARQCVKPIASNSLWYVKSSRWVQLEGQGHVEYILHYLTTCRDNLKQLLPLVGWMNTSYLPIHWKHTHINWKESQVLF